MKEKRKGLLHLAVVIAAIALCVVVAFIGIGKQHKGSARNIKLGLDLAGGVSITYETVEENPSEEALNDTKYKMQKRVENYSTESDVYKEGNNRINVDIPGVTDANKILKELGNAGSIQFIVGEGNIQQTGIDEDGKAVYELTKTMEEIYAAGDVVLDGSDITTAKEGTNQGQLGTIEYIVSLTLNETGTKKFAEATAANVNKIIAIVYDGKVESAPVVNEAITGGTAQISGQKDMDEATQLASTIRIGALPLELKEIRSNVVGAKLGEEAINTSLIAGLIGFILVLLFMIIMYRIPGIAAGIALSLYIGLMVVLLNGFNVTLTLPGIAGIILSIGMAVDANVIIFTRIKEELATGKTVKSAIKIGFDKALSAIIDGNVTTLIAAAVLWIKGSGTIKGFAQTLALGIVLSMLTALFVTKFVLKALYYLGFNDVKFFGVQKEVKVKQFVKNAPKFYAVSAVIIIIGLAVMGINSGKGNGALNYGLDFKGGTSTQVTFNDNITTATKSGIVDLFSNVIKETPEISEIQGENSLLIKSRELTLDERSKIEEKIISDFGVSESNIATESISATVSSEMKTDAVVAVIISTICMLIYIWIRFKDIKFGASAVLALLHDVLIVLTVYAVCRISVGNTFIACMLTIVGYSINATIVIFDRIRENKGVMRNSDDLEQVVNNSISQTVSRSINTSLTTFFMVFVLAILGVDSVKEFAIPLIAGIIGGAFSSICITGTLWYFLKAKLVKKSK